MKKWIVVSVIMVFVVILASQALACWSDGNYGGHMMGYGGHMMGWGPGGGYYSREYLNETAALRQELASKRGEYTALMTHADPDPKVAAQLSKEIVGLQDQLQLKAQARGLLGPGGYGYGPGGGKMGLLVNPSGRGGKGVGLLSRSMKSR